jgi:hypothetical protein
MGDARKKHAVHGMGLPDYFSTSMDSMVQGLRGWTNGMKKN